VWGHQRSTLKGLSYKNYLMFFISALINFMTLAGNGTKPSSSATFCTVVQRPAEKVGAPFPLNRVGAISYPSM